jgi:CRP-like cAMP-binding protein
MNPWRYLANKRDSEEIPHEDTETMFSEMFQLFKMLHPQISDILMLDIRERSRAVRFKRKALILDYGETCGHVFFAARGLVRALFQREGIEQTCWFMGEGDIVIAVESFYSQQPSKERLVALEDTDCIALAWDDLQTIYANHVEFNVIGRKLTEFYYRQAIERTKWVCLSAKERYELLFTDYPKFFNRVPDVALASYLGIDKSYLSRIRTAVNFQK